MKISKKSWISFVFDFEFCVNFPKGPNLFYSYDDLHT